MSPWREKAFYLFSLIICAAFILAQEIQHEAVAVNIEVPVRVYSKGNVIDNLKIDDFELYDDGKIQKIDALYFLKHSEITRIETREEFRPDKPLIKPNTQRHFVLIFQMMKYLPEVGDAIDYFFSDVLQRDDTLIVMSPLKTYRFKKDIQNYSFEYRNLKHYLMDLIGDPTYASMSGKGGLIETLVERMRDHIYLDPARVKQFSSFLTDLEGQKHVILLFQNELMPVPKSEGYSVSDMEFTQATLDINEIRQYFAESSIHFHFSYITRRENNILDITRQLSYETARVEFIEFKQDLFSVFKDIADTTGGITDSSYNARISFQKAVEAVENYYLLYYTPNNYRADGKYHSIKLKIKEGGYRIVHRQGYIAD
ncbi:MAG: hypothetical protein ABIK95_06215 [Acidobacteriota bacterium]|nr:hypothetical protein [Acidobacteriota bacterium]